MRTKVCLFLLLGALWPGVARAQFWGILQQMSGPGPYNGPVFTVRAFCVPTAPPEPCYGPLRPGRQFVEIHLGFFSSGDRRRFDDVPDDSRPVRVFQLEPAYVYRFHATLDAGFGAGLFVIHGDGFDALSRLVITPLTVSLAPFAATSSSGFARAFRLRFEQHYLPQRLDGSDFQSPTSYSAKGELLASFAVVLDLGGLIP
jgi:hypothetical protein